MFWWAVPTSVMGWLLWHTMLPASTQVALAFSPTAGLKQARPQRVVFHERVKPAASRGKKTLATDPLMLGFLGGGAAALVGSMHRRRIRSAMARAAGSASVSRWVTPNVVSGPTPAETGSMLRLFSPAKINLFLRITQRRPDGYHELASLFQTVSFGDTLDIELLPSSAERDQLECDLPDVPVDDSNLVIRALRLFRERSGVKRFFRVRLEKHTPTQAGMGGGSSNAATAFFGANALCGSPGSQADLLKWADDPVIGSDASFFLSEGTAFCTGRGEVVKPVRPLPLEPGLHLYLVKPRYGLSTPKVFKALDLDTLSTVDPHELLTTFQEHGTSHTCWVNDLERPAFEVCPELGELKTFLAGEEWGFKAVMMSGSGTTIFCLGDPRGGKEALEAAARDRGFDLEGIWRASFLRKTSADAWYDAPELIE